MCKSNLKTNQLNQTNQLNNQTIHRRQVERAEAQAFADENGLSYVEASAKNADGVDEVFMSTCEKVWDNMKNGVFSRRNTTRPDDVSDFTLFYPCLFLTFG